MSDANTMLARAKSALIARDYVLAAKIYKNLILEEPFNVLQVFFVIEKIVLQLQHPLNKSYIILNKGNKKTYYS